MPRWPWFKLTTPHPPFFEALKEHPAVVNRWQPVWAAVTVRSRRRFLRGLAPAIRAYQKQLAAAPEERLEAWAEALLKLNKRLEIYVGRNGKASAVCGQCRGSCCALDIGTGYLGDPADLYRFAQAPEVLWRSLVNPGGRGCCFRGPAGCAFPPAFRPRRCAVYNCTLIENLVPFRALDKLLDALDAFADLPLLEHDFSFRDLVLGTGIPEPAWTFHYQNAVSLQRQGSGKRYIEALLAPECDRFSLRVYVPLALQPGTQAEAMFRMAVFNARPQAATVVYDEVSQEFYSRTNVLLGAGRLPEAAIRWALAAAQQGATELIELLKDVSELDSP